jgi:hypothetical protein
MMNNWNARLSYRRAGALSVTVSYLEAEPFPEVQAPSFLDPASQVRWYGTNE